MVEKAFAVGVGGIVGQNVRLALAGCPIEVHDVDRGPRRTAGHERVARAAARRRARRPARPLTFLDLRADIVERELARLRDGQRSGPHAENMLRDIGIVASGAV